MDWQYLLKHDMKNKAPTLEKWNQGAFSRRNQGQYGRDMEVKAYERIHIVLETAHLPGKKVVEQILSIIVNVQTDCERSLITPLLIWNIEYGEEKTIGKIQSFHMKHRSAIAELASDIIDNSSHPEKLVGELRYASGEEEELFTRFISDIKRRDAILFIKKEDDNSRIQVPSRIEGIMGKRVWIVIEKYEGVPEII